MYFVVMPRVNLIVIVMTCVRYLYSINFPTVICLPSMLLFILWRDATSELWTPVQFSLHCFTILLLLALFTFLHTIILLPLDTLNPLFTANRWDWQPHRKLGAKFLVVLCEGFTLLLVKSYAPTSSLSGALVRSVAKLASITFWSLAFSYWFNQPWFHNWGKTCYCAHHTFLLGFPTGCTYTPSCLPKGEGSGIPTATLEGGGPWRAVSPWPSSSLDQLGSVEDPSPLEMAAKGRKISRYGWWLQKIGFSVNI
jgi:energy-coupling factor transporter transmembrane protein EcfT